MDSEKQFPPTMIPALISIVMLFIGIPEFLPYGYYKLLRFVICGTGVYIAYFAFEEEKRFIGFLSVLIVLLFNPLIPIHLNKDVWILIDFMTAIFFAITIFSLRFVPEVYTNSSDGANHDSFEQDNYQEKIQDIDPDEVDPSNSKEEFHSVKSFNIVCPYCNKSYSITLKWHDNQSVCPFCLKVHDVDLDWQ
jgi:hypothetical protein